MLKLDGRPVELPIEILDTHRASLRGDLLTPDSPEYDDARSGSFSPLRFVPKGKIVVLGLVSTKVGKLESKDELKRRIDEAAKYVPLEQMCLSPQCGFSSTVHGNEIAMENQRKKLQRVIEVALEVWGDAGVARV